jgi:hypothetical protein
VAFQADGQTLTWSADPSAMAYDVSRGNIPAGGTFAYNYACAETVSGATELLDPTFPALGEVLFSVVESTGVCGSSGPGVDGQGVPRPSPTPCPLLEAHFDIDEDRFVYVDDAFRGTSEPSYANGARIDPGGFTGGGLQVSLGGIDAATIVGMSGGWQESFTTGGSPEVLVSFRYNLTQTATYESSEVSQVLVSVDGVLYGAPPNDYVAQVVGDGNSGSPITTGWVLFQVNLGVLAPGSHTLILGGYNSEKDKANESTEILIDDVLVERAGG